MTEQTPPSAPETQPPVEPPWDAEAAVQAAKAKVQTLLLRETEIGIDQRGRFWVERGSTRAFLELVPREPNRHVYLIITCPIAFYVPESPALFERIAREADKWYFGHFGISPYSADSGHAGTVYVYLAHTLLADFLDPEDLYVPLFAMLNAADEIDDPFVAEFGGVRYEDS